MHTRRTLEVWVGLFVALGLAALFILAMQVSNIGRLTEGPGYLVEARFSNVSGLKERAPVSIAGVRVGRVKEIDYDAATFEAVVRMQIARQFDRIPIDTGAVIYTSGILGEKYIGLEPGGFDEYLGDGDEITLTQSAVVLEQLIGRFLFSEGE